MPAFVGRATEVGILVDLCAGFGEVPGPVVALVHGQPGDGKTRLLTEVCARLTGVDRVHLAGHEPESPIPLAASRDLLRVLSGGPEGTLVERLFRPEPAAPIEMVQLFEAVFRTLRARPPLALVVDDLQWVDATSAALLHYLVRAAETSQLALLLLGAGRSTVASTHFAESLAGVVSDPGRLVRLDLGPLDRTAGIGLVRALEPDVHEAEAEDVWRRARGSPFWIEALAGERSGAEPGSVLGFRLRAVSGDAAALLARLAVVGRRFERSALAEVGGWSVDRLDRAADDLIELGLATDSGGSLAVSHDLVRDKVAGSLSAEQAQRAHRELAGWFERYGADDASMLEALEHGRRGGVSLVRVALLLAESPRRRLLGAEGLGLLRTVAADSDMPDGASLGRAVAHLAGELGEHEIALGCWTTVLGRATAPAQVAESALAAAECAFHLGRATEAERLLGLADRSADGGEEVAIEVDSRAAAVLLWLRHRGPEGQEAALRAVRAARRLADRLGGVGRLSAPERHAYLRALHAGAEAGILADRPADVLVLTDELAAEAGEEDVRLRVRALAEGSLALRWLGRNADAEARLRTAWQEAQAHTLPQATVEVGALLAKVLYSRGRLTESSAVLAECDAIGDRLAEFCPARALTPVITHLLDATCGDWQRAADGLRRAARAEKDPHYRAHVHLERALVLARCDPRRLQAEVHTDVASALADAAGSGCRRCAFEVTVRSAEALARIGRPETGRELLAAVEADRRDGNPALGWWLRQGHAAVLTAEGNASAAVTAWTETVAEAERFGMVFEALGARIDLGKALAGTDRPAAAAALREAGAAAEAMGASTEMQAAEQALRALGVRTWRRPGGSAPPTLTAREREIAVLVAAGSSNSEIAAALFLSRKTVERHVSNVLAKAGLRNRAELAAAWSSGTVIGAATPEGVPR